MSVPKGRYPLPEIVRSKRGTALCAVFKDNLSPLHWEGAKAKIVTSHDEIEKLKSFCAPIFDKLMIPFCGLDVVKNKAGEYWLIEAN